MKNNHPKFHSNLVRSFQNIIGTDLEKVVLRKQHLKFKVYENEYKRFFLYILETIESWTT